MRRLSIVSITLVALVGLAVGLYAAENETFTGIAAVSGTYKRPQLLVDGKRYELKASDKADASVAEMLAKFSKGGRGTYVVKGTRGTVNGVDGIIIDGITPAAIPPTGPVLPRGSQRESDRLARHPANPLPTAPGPPPARVRVSTSPTSTRRRASLSA